MNEIVNKFLLGDDKFMPEMHLKQPGFIYSACGLFTKNEERIEKFMQTENTDFIYGNELDKGCFQHVMVYGKWKDLAKRIESDKVLRDKAFKIASDPKYDGYQRGLPSLVYKFFDKKPSGSGASPEPNYQLANELHGQIFITFKRRKVYSSFRNDIWGVDKCQIKYLLCAIDLFRKYAWVVPLKSKRGISVVNAFQKIISKRKPNKVWVEPGGEIYNKLFKMLLKINNIEMYSAYNEGKSVFAERFIKKLENKTFKQMTAVSKNVYFDVLDDIINKYNNTVYRSIKMKKNWRYSLLEVFMKKNCKKLVTKYLG